MPQLDKLSFVPQLFWLVFFFLGLYLIIVEILLPKIHTIIQIRALKSLMHNIRINALNEEKVTNKVYGILFAKLFKNTDIFASYIDSFNKITPQTYGNDFYNSLKEFRLSNALELENAYFEMQIKKQIAQDLIKK